MDYEQKYKEALNKAQNELQCCGTLDCDAARQIFRLFPELKESEDENWRKWLINHLKGYINQTNERYGEVCKEAIAWLEKQGEQKSPNNYTPKFKVGDWITNGDYTWKIVDVKSLDYILQSQDGNIVDDTIYHVDTNFNLWTIQDAKDGDILSQDNVPFIFKRWDNNCIAYCGITDFGLFKIVEDDFSWCNSINVTPATKEQCDLLFQKMHDAGYTWDAEKKELIKKQS